MTASAGRLSALSPEGAGPRPTSRATCLVLAAVLLGGCAREGTPPPLPAACSAGPTTVMTALRAAPRPVRLDGARISDCLARHSSGTDLQSVGSSLVGAAGALSDRAARAPEGRSALELGYLAGAAERGASGPGGNTSREIARRVGLELDVVERGSRAVRVGLRAGRTTG